MELWIRSQNKEYLIEAKSLYITNYETKDKNKSFYDIGSWGYPFALAKYKTKERALEVLDDINEVLNHKCMFNIDKDSWRAVFATYSSEKQNRILTNMSVYEMPEE